MQGIEFDSVVQHAAIPLPESASLASGMPVRVVVMFEDKPAVNSPLPFQDAISALCANSLIVNYFEPLSRDQSHER